MKKVLIIILFLSKVNEDLQFLNNSIKNLIFKYIIFFKKYKKMFRTISQKDFYDILISAIL